MLRKMTKSSQLGGKILSARCAAWLILRDYSAMTEHGLSSFGRSTQKDDGTKKTWQKIINSWPKTYILQTRTMTLMSTPRLIAGKLSQGWHLLLSMCIITALPLKATKTFTITPSSNSICGPVTTASFMTEKRGKKKFTRWNLTSDNNDVGVLLISFVLIVVFINCCIVQYSLLTATCTPICHLETLKLHSVLLHFPY